MTAPIQPPPPRVLLVVWTGTDWHLLEPLLAAGKLPVLAALRERGLHAPLRSLEPLLDAPLATSLATGLTPEHHGHLLGLIPAPTETGTRPEGPADRHAPALWNRFTSPGRTAHVFGWPLTHPAESVSGVMVSDQPTGSPALAAGSVHPPAEAENHAELRWSPHEFSAHDIAAFLPGMDPLQVSEDPRASLLAFHLADTVSVNASATYALEQAAWDFAAIHFAAPGNLALALLAPASAPPEGQAATNSEVIERVLRLHDDILGNLMTHAGPDALVLWCSLWGVEPLPPPAPGQHRLHRDPRRFPGAVILAGPGVKKGRAFLPPSLLDLAPTLLGLAGLPVPQGLDGHPWGEAWARPARLPVSPETLPPDFVEAALPETLSPAASPAEQARFATAASRCHALALRHLASGRPALAEPLLASLVAAQPERLRPTLELIEARLQLGRLDEARALLDEVSARPLRGLRERPGLTPADLPEFGLLRSRLALASGNAAEALALLTQASAEAQPLPAYQLQIGRALSALRRWSEAREAFRRVLQVDPRCLPALLGEAAASLRLRQWETAAETALAAVEISPEDGSAHLLLGLALARLRQDAPARQALQQALARRVQPRLVHLFLAVLCGRHPATSHLARFHREVADALRRPTPIT